MKNLIDITINREDKCFIDADTVRAIKYNPAYGRLSIDMGDNSPFEIDNIDAEDIEKIVDKIIKSGNDLVAITRSSRNGADIPEYISPEFVRFLTVSEEEIETGKMKAVIGLAGHGIFETDDLNQDILDSLIEKIEEYGVELTKFDPDFASSRFKKPSALYMDVSNISKAEILDYDYIFIGFEGIDKDLSIKIPASIIDENIMKLDIPNIKGINSKIDDHIIDAEEVMGNLRDVFNRGDDVNPILHSNDTRKIRNKISFEIRREFARELLKENKDLIELSSDNGSIFFKKDSISDITTSRLNGCYDLYISIRESADNKFSNRLRIYFDTKEELELALDKIKNNGKQAVISNKAKLKR